MNILFINVIVQVGKKKLRKLYDIYKKKKKLHRCINSM